MSLYTLICEGIKYLQCNILTVHNDYLQGLGFCCFFRMSSLHFLYLFFLLIELKLT